MPLATTRVIRPARAPGASGKLRRERRRHRDDTVEAAQEPQVEAAIEAQRQGLAGVEVKRRQARGNAPPRGRVRRRASARTITQSDFGSWPCSAAMSPRAQPRCQRAPRRAPRPVGIVDLEGGNRGRGEPAEQRMLDGVPRPAPVEQRHLRPEAAVAEAGQELQEMALRTGQAATASKVQDLPAQHARSSRRSAAASQRS